MDELKKIRDEIDSIDYQMAKLYEQRLQAVTNVIQYKMEHNLPVLDQNREQEILSRNQTWVSEPYRECYKRFQKYVMEESKQFQQQEKERES